MVGSSAAHAETVPQGVSALSRTWRIFRAQAAERTGLTEQVDVGIQSAVVRDGISHVSRRE